MVTDHYAKLTILSPMPQMSICGYGLIIIATKWTLSRSDSVDFLEYLFPHLRIPWAPKWSGRHKLFYISFAAIDKEHETCPQWNLKINKLHLNAIQELLRTL